MHVIPRRKTGNAGLTTWESPYSYRYSYRLEKGRMLEMGIPPEEGGMTF